MQSVVFEYVDRDWSINIWLGSYEYYYTLLNSESCRQLIRAVQLNHSKEDREYINSLTQDELYFALTKFMKDNELLVIRPN